MKNISRALLVLGVIASCACQPQTTSTTNNANKPQTQAAVATNSANISASDADDAQVLLIGRPNNETKVKVNIVDSDTTGKCRIEVRDDDDQKIELKPDKGKVRWDIDNDCAAGGDARIVMEGFTDAFGADPCDNKFILDPIKNNENGRFITKTGKKPGYYKYTIRLIRGQNENVADPLDPVIVIADRQQ